MVVIPWLVTAYAITRTCASHEMRTSKNDRSLADITKNSKNKIKYYHHVARHSLYNRRTWILSERNQQTVNVHMLENNGKNTQILHAFEHCASVGLRSMRSNITICQKSKQKFEEMRNLRTLEKVLWPFVFQYVTVYLDALGHSRHRHHRFVFKHIFVFYRNSIFWNTIAFYTILNIIILSLHDVDQSGNTMTKVLEAVDFIFDSDGNEKWIGLFLQKILWILLLLLF